MGLIVPKEREEGGDICILKNDAGILRGNARCTEYTLY